MQAVPLWVRTERTLWREDECTRLDHGAERLGEAWRRLFGCEFADDPIVAEHDGGDVFLYLHASGRISSQAYDGDGIGVARVVEVL